MQRIQYIITALPFLLIGIFCCYYSKRLTTALIKSSQAMNEAFNIKKAFGKGEENFIRISLIVFGVLLFLAGIRLLTAKVGDVSLF